MSEQAQQVTQSVEWVYAAALLDLAGQAEQRDEVRSELDEVGDLLASEPDLTKLLASRVLSTAERRGCLERLFTGQVSDLTYRFLQVVNDKERLADLAGIIRAYGRLVDEQRGLVDVDAYVATPMDDAQVRRVAAALELALEGQVVLHQHVEAHLIGGLKLRLGDRLIDGSVATQLRRMRDQIVAAGRDRARRQHDQAVEGTDG